MLASQYDGRRYRNHRIQTATDVTQSLLNRHCNRGGLVKINLIGTGIYLVQEDTAALTLTLPLPSHQEQSPNLLCVLHVCRQITRRTPTFPRFVVLLLWITEELECPQAAHARRCN